MASPYVDIHSHINYTLKYIKGGLFNMTDNKNFGVINEQGYPVGQFGFTPVNESDQKAIEESEKKDKEDEK